MDPPLNSIKDFLISCSEDDNKSNKSSKPATKKLENLDLFTKTLLNKKNQDILLDDNILGVVRMWLEPLPDKTLPNINIRKRLLEVLKVINVDKNHLLESGIGKIVHFYSLNPKENVEIKRLALEIIQKWTRRVVE
ncbi:Transcription factor IWS1 [Nosema bombycis CQ1]|uniref:Transcription factor IWS1 n=1 Tax=Nosema bombycis (strain CQ1 / CVCC 102059) TaxID=578461 RepID=R0MPD6_NOSB1|nr:Transcription factor IWS1 [Nosema bombycis CQ1]|eukprot:EOB14733.1 Transcription factor IWS1 [Nosema bombycis CQ1]